MGKSTTRNARTLESMRRESDAHTASGKRVREGRPAPRRTGTRAGVIRDAMRDAR